MIGNDVRLYILMRTDLASMNPGKAVAQGAHAANQCVAEIDITRSDRKDLLTEWETQTRSGFGTTITLGVNEKTLRERIAIARALDIHAGITHDPTYPLLDGATLHLLPLDTCGYVLAPKAAADLVLFGLNLMP